MRKSRFVSLCTLVLLIMNSCANGELRSFTPGEIWPDNNGIHINAHGVGILTVGDTYYWYGEHKTEGAKGNFANMGVHCYSSQNLHDWQDEGIVLKVSDNPNSEIAKGCILERPKVIYNKKNNNYVMWFHLEPKGAGYTGARSGVAVSDSPVGPFRYLESVRPNAGHWAQNINPQQKDAPVLCDGLKFSGGGLPDDVNLLNIAKRDFEGGQMARDMNLFVDQDDKAYHIYSSEENSTLHVALLDESYTKHSGVYTRNFEGRFMEAPAMFKRDGKYYLIMSGCSGWDPNQARSAIAESPLGPWRELGNPAIGDSTNTTFHSQSSYVLQVGDKYIYMGDRWRPEDAIDGRYIWLPLEFDGEAPKLRWADSWSL